MLTQLSNYDFVFGAIILVSAALAMLRGGVAELLSLSRWFIALFVMRHYAPQIEKIIPQLVSNQLFRSLISYILAFLVVALAIALLKNIFHKFIKSTGLGGLDYALGGLFGIVRGLIICAILILILEMFHLDDQHGWQRSWLSPILIPGVTMLANAIPERVKNINHELGSQAEALIQNDPKKQGK